MPFLVRKILKDESIEHIENIEDNEVYQSLFQAIKSENTATSNERSLKRTPILQRQISYSPPAGSITLISYREKEAIE